MKTSWKIMNKSQQVLNCRHHLFTTWAVFYPICLWIFILFSWLEVMNKSCKSHEQIVNNSWTKCEQLAGKSWKNQTKEWSIHEQIVKKSRSSHAKIIKKFWTIFSGWVGVGLVQGRWVYVKTSGRNLEHIMNKLPIKHEKFMIELKKSWTCLEQYKSGTVQLNNK